MVSLDQRERLTKEKKGKFSRGERVELDSELCDAKKNFRRKISNNS